MAEGFKRLYRYPRVKRHTRDFRLLPRDAWRIERSKARYALRPDRYEPSALPLAGEIGTIEGFRFIVSS